MPTQKSPRKGRQPAAVKKSVYTWPHMLITLAVLVSMGIATVSNMTKAAPKYPSGTPPATLLFGVGPEADTALTTPIVQQSPVKMLTSWYNSPSDLAWMPGWEDDVVPQAYAQGYALHLVVFTDGAEGSVSTAYGPACGRAYPLSAGFLTDMQILAQTFDGSGPLYVTLFSEFQTYPCQDNQWSGAENYYNALKDQYRDTRDIFRQYAPNSKVSIGWGGWQTRWDDVAAGGGRSLFARFNDIMAESEFQSFQAMQSDTNVSDIKEMTSTLSTYGPVMLAHLKPDNGSQVVFDADVAAILTDSFMADITQRGLFALSFMDTVNIGSSGSTFNLLKNGITKYASTGLLPYTASASVPASAPVSPPVSTPQNATATPSNTASAKPATDADSTPGQGAGSSDIKANTADVAGNAKAKLAAQAVAAKKTQTAFILGSTLVLFAAAGFVGWKVWRSRTALVRRRK